MIRLVRSVHLIDTVAAKLLLLPLVFRNLCRSKRESVYSSGRSSLIISYFHRFLLSDFFPTPPLGLVDRALDGFQSNPPFCLQCFSFFEPDEVLVDDMVLTASYLSGVLIPWPDSLFFFSSPKKTIPPT